MMMTEYMNVTTHLLIIMVTIFTAGAIIVVKALYTLAHLTRAIKAALAFKVGKDSEVEAALVEVKHYI